MKEFFEMFVQNSMFFNIWNTTGAIESIGVLVMLILILTSSVVNFSSMVGEIRYSKFDIKDILIPLIPLSVIVLFIIFVVVDFINIDKDATTLFWSCMIIGVAQATVLGSIWS